MIYPDMHISAFQKIIVGKNEFDFTMQKTFDNIASNPRKIEIDEPTSWQVPVD